ncbi:Arginine decarboxylase [Spatholobus suberectus]|nr:Arginine decarboxylase [Spatholobus suberectus]
MVTVAATATMIAMVVEAVMIVVVVAMLVAVVVVAVSLVVVVPTVATTLTGAEDGLPVKLELPKVKVRTLVATKLELNTVVVIEQEEEVDLIVDLSKKLCIKPVIGLRAKLRTKHFGHFGGTSGEKGKFGLTTAQILRIPFTALLVDGVGEAAQIYCKLVRLGANMRVIDIGGGLGIDYDGSKLCDSDIFVGYSLEEYAAAVAHAVQCVCDRRAVKHPVICSESGRAIVSHHSVLVFEVIGTSASRAASPALSAHYLAEELSEDYRILSDAAFRGDCETCLLYTEEMKQRYVEQFKQGAVCMEQLATVEGLCELVRKAVRAGNSFGAWFEYMVLMPPPKTSNNMATRGGIFQVRF